LNDKKIWIRQSCGGPTNACQTTVQEILAEITYYVTLRNN